MNSAHWKKTWILPLLPVLLAGCTESSEGDPSRVVARQADEPAAAQRVDGGAMTTALGGAAAPARPEFAKVVAFDMSVDKNGVVALKNPRVYYGEPPNQIGNPPMFTAQLLDSLGNVTFEVPLWDPRWTFVWSEENNRDFVDLADAAETVVVVPFQPNIAAIKVIRDKESVAAVELTQVVATFCAKNREDPDCRGNEQTRQK